jgi:hypothetical protein
MHASIHHGTARTTPHKYADRSKHEKGKSSKIYGRWLVPYGIHRMKAFSLPETDEAQMAATHAALPQSCG